MTDIDVAQKHAIDMQLLAVSCARSYGVLALGGLLGLNAIGLFTGNSSAFVSGAMLAIFAAAFAYINFTAIAAGWARIVMPAMIGSVLCGVGSGMLFLQGAL